MRRLACAMLVALAAATPRAARADAKHDAEALFRVGQQAFDAAQYDHAADAFEQAYDKLALPAIAFSAAQAERLQYFADHQPRRLARAIELYHLYLTGEPDGPRRGDAITLLAQIEPLLGAMKAAGALGDMEPVAKETSMMVVADVPGARATIDGGEPAATPLTRDVAPGDHAIVVTADGYEPFEITQPALPDHMFPVEAHLVAKAAHLVVRASDGAHVSIDGRLAGDAPLAALEVPAGSHLVAVWSRGHDPFQREVKLARGATLQLDAALPATTQRKVARWLLVGGGVAAAVAVVSGVAALSADSDASSLLAKLRAGNAPADTVTAYQNARDSRDARATTAEVFGGIALTAALTGVALYLFDEPVLGGHF